MGKKACPLMLVPRAVGELAALRVSAVTLHDGVAALGPLHFR